MITDERQLVAKVAESIRANAQKATDLPHFERPTPNEEG
jgi:hypothetical protein